MLNKCLDSSSVCVCVVIWSAVFGIGLCSWHRAGRCWRAAHVLTSHGFRCCRCAQATTKSWSLQAAPVHTSFHKSMWQSPTLSFVVATEMLPVSDVFTLQLQNRHAVCAFYSHLFWEIHLSGLNLERSLVWMHTMVAIFHNFITILIWWFAVGGAQRHLVFSEWNAGLLNSYSFCSA